jgi:hypothetical protein
VTLGDDCGSDHCPIHLNLDFAMEISYLKKRRMWKFEEDGWRKFCGELPELPEFPLENQGTESIENKKKILVENIFKAGIKTFKRTRAEVNLKYCKVWWAGECERATRARKAAKKLLLNRPTERNAELMREADNHAKQILREAKANSWKDYINQINSTSPIGEVWRKIKNMNSAYKPHTSPLMVVNNIITNNEDKADVFSEHFGSLFNNNQAQIPDHRVTNMQERVIGACRDNSAEYNCPITMLELETTVQSLKGSF